MNLPLELMIMIFNLSWGREQYYLRQTCKSLRLIKMTYAYKRYYVKTQNCYYEKQIKSKLFLHVVNAMKYFDNVYDDAHYLEMGTVKDIGLHYHQRRRHMLIMKDGCCQGIL